MSCIQSNKPKCSGPNNINILKCVINTYVRNKASLPRFHTKKHRLQCPSQTATTKARQRPKPQSPRPPPNADFCSPEQCQLNELKSSQVPAASSLRSALLDPAVNCLVQQLRNELQSTKLRLEDTQNELSAWKFTPDSNTGKRLMAKCRMLYQENEELGKVTSSGRIATLEGDLALQKSFSEEVRQSQLELDCFLADLDEDVEGMQSTILFLQQELRKAKEQLQGAPAAGQKQQPLANGRANGDSVCAEQERTDSESEVERTRVKRVRRSSVLSIDYNEDDTLVINANGDVAMSSDAE